MDLKCLCYKGKFEFIGKKNCASIYRCQRCNTIYSDGEWHDDDFYRQHYNTKSSSVVPYSDRYEHDCEVALNRLSAVFKHLNFSPCRMPMTTYSLLDVGCGNGAFVDTASNYGLDAYGVELMDIDFKQPDRIIKGNFWKWDIDFGRQYDIITLFDSLEHFPYPFIAIAKIAKIANLNSIVVIDQPNPCSEESIKYGLGWKHIKPYEHVYLVSEQFLTEVFAALQFTLSLKTQQINGRMFLIYETTNKL